MLTISFSITFDPSDAGIQTITATVNPGHEPPETDYSYNAKSVQVKVVGDFKLMLNLSVPEVYPNNTSGNSNTIITALLSDSAGNPVYGKSIQFYSAPQDGSGGHIAEIHHGARPKGTFESSSCTTGADGTCQVTYTASQFGGLEKILGNLSGNASVKDSKTLTVKVPALAPLSGGPYTFKCFGNSSEPSCPGGGYGHTSFYSVQSFVDEDMFAIASAYSGTFPGAPLLTVTDASLSWGGLYDYKNTWTNPHRFHREGTDIDIRSTSIPDDNQETFESIVCRLGGFPNLELAGLPNEHYHLYFHTYSSAISSYCQDSQ
ncbi:MAG TPA: hypothetical protein DCS07_02015 [Bdellovibrionales bacterium]|nr:MAG: hypothetical protein A2Z97_14435 [Bdellovibrionales bacterium GWB1_52_6]OFZ06188.1 MAG: hypothetical protein A2X97_09045 [Bdellovibrionales bacterium GWA1_52_35]OFZ40155.1 MAG: hypothetical protein A2070_02325 [Bdellovibrionales bacterium GWC1_52_8]HAR41400.1 hypothetical protein [Bdellovibrionales bacterium]HCM41169.1 hypothetical protein [Bdellovibrionales bacterium]